MKILVTGDKGFIGQRLVKRLQKDNHTNRKRGEERGDAPER